MKSNLMIKKYIVESDNGTKNMKTIKSFFGTKLIDIEDSIIIDNKSIRYSDINGYQYFNIEYLGATENEQLIDLTDLKNTYHTISLQTQSIIDIENSTKWSIDIDIKNILKKYLFGKIKESRTFKTIKTIDTKNSDIDDSIYSFIDYNILNRYELDKIDFYVKYTNFNTSNVFNNNIIQYNPIFIDILYNDTYLIKNYNLIKKDQFENLTNIKILFNQIKPSTDYKFDYYFNINYKKI